jgi:drug/metabolite transporter (DMT)-like permease
MLAQRFLPYAAITVAMVIFGFSFYFTKDALSHAGTFQLLGFRFLAAAAILTVLAACGLVKLRLTKQKLPGLLLIALFQPVLYFIGETVGVKLTSASESGVIIALIPIFVPLLSVAVVKEKISLARWLAIAVCVAGVVLIIFSKGFEGSGGHLAGIAALLSAVFAASFYTTVSARASHGCTPMEVTFIMMWAGAIVFNAIGFSTAAAQSQMQAYTAPLADGRFLLDLLYLGVLSSIVAFFFLNYSLSKLEATTVGAFENLVPVISMFAGVVVGGEKLVILQYAGAALILAGIWGAARGKTAVSAPPLPVPPE